MNTQNILDGLQHCSQADCTKCPYESEGVFCIERLTHDALAQLSFDEVWISLINRIRAGEPDKEVMHND